MRRKDKEITEATELLDIIHRCRVCRLAMLDEEGLYIVPLNYGYAWEENRLTFYFHSAKEGRKIRALQTHPEVAFELDCDHRLLAGDIPCKSTYGFKSIIGNGMVRFIDEPEERKKALSLLLSHQLGRDCTVTDAMQGAVALFKLEVSSFSGKASPAKPVD